MRFRFRPQLDSLDDRLVPDATGFAPTTPDEPVPAIQSPADPLPDPTPAVQVTPDDGAQPINTTIPAAAPNPALPQPLPAPPRTTPPAPNPGDTLPTQPNGTRPATPDENRVIQELRQRIIDLTAERGRLMNDYASKQNELSRLDEVNKNLHERHRRLEEQYAEAKKNGNLQEQERILREMNETQANYDDYMSKRNQLIKDMNSIRNEILWTDLEIQEAQYSINVILHGINNNQPSPTVPDWVKDGNRYSGHTKDDILKAYPNFDNVQPPGRINPNDTLPLPPRPPVIVHPAVPGGE